MPKREFTAVYQKRGKRYIAWIEEIPGVNTQGRTHKETRENLEEALRLVLSSRRAISKKPAGGKLKQAPIQIEEPA